MANNYTLLVLKALLGLLGVVAWVIFGASLLSLRQYVDKKKVTKAELAKFSKGGIPAKEQLTKEGVKRYKFMIISFTTGLLLCGGIIVFNELSK